MARERRLARLRERFRPPTPKRIVEQGYHERLFWAYSHKIGTVLTAKQVQQLVTDYDAMVEALSGAKRNQTDAP